MAGRIPAKQSTKQQAMHICYGKYNAIGVQGNLCTSFPLIWIFAHKSVVRITVFYPTLDIINM